MGKGIKGFQKGNADGKRFTRRYQPRNRGRKKSLYTAILLQNQAKKEEPELSREEYSKMIKYLLERTMSELRELRKDALENESSDLPVWIVVFINAMFSDIKKGKANFLIYLIDRLFGKAEIRVQVNNQIHQVNSINVQNLTKEEIEQLDLLISKLTTTKR